MDQIKNKIKLMSKEYDKGIDTLHSIKDVTSYCLEKLSEIESIEYASTSSKPYRVLNLDGLLSRPYIKELMFQVTDEFKNSWDNLEKKINAKNCSIDLAPSELNKLIYTSVMSVALCFDLWATKSRKTPGTFFEIILGSLISKCLPDYHRQKFISLPGCGEKVATDIVFNKGEKGIVIPAKISTRERIVQPYAHQRILDAVFGEHRYISLLMSVCETQRDDKNLTTNDICVPGTIKLFQQHLSAMGGMYYLDPPKRYLADDLKDTIHVSTIGDFLAHDLYRIVEQLSVS